MLREYSVTVQRHSRGGFVARFETDTHYAVGQGDTPEEAIERATVEASMIIHDDYYGAQINAA